MDLTWFVAVKLSTTAENFCRHLCIFAEENFNQSMFDVMLLKLMNKLNATYVWLYLLYIFLLIVSWVA